MKVIRAILLRRDLVSSPTVPALRTQRIARKTITSKAIAGLALASVISCATLPFGGCKGQSLNLGPSTGEVVGVIVGAGAVIGGGTAILIAVHHSHHTLKGCVSAGSNGLEAVSDDNKTYLLTGNTPGIAAGSMMKFHGTKLKMPKHGNGDRTFEVQKISKNYGPCKVTPSTTASLSDLDGPAGPDELGERDAPPAE